MKQKIDLSVVVPVYNGVPFLAGLCDRVKAVCAVKKLKYEIILVNDCSPDESWEVIRKLAGKNPAVKGVNLSRNFGQHAAITAGLEFVQGAWVVVMDCDLQDRPEEIPAFFEKAAEGYDVVVGRRMSRKDPFLKRMTSKWFYMLFNYLTGQKIDHRVANFGLYARKVIESIKRFAEKDRAFGLMVVQAGFKRAAIDISHGERTEGESGYSFKKRLNMALDLILSHSVRPLRLTVKAGFVIALLSAFSAGFLILKKIITPATISGWTSLIVAVCFFSGLIIATIGMVGLYVGKIFDQVKNRPLYIVDEKTFKD